MLAIFFIMFGSIGVILNWPVIQEGIFPFLTSAWGGNSLSFELQQYSPGYSRPDGMVVIGISVLILLSAFIRTRRSILNLRILSLIMVLAILSAELFTVFRLKLPLYAYTGLLYSGLFYFLALVSAIFRFGSMKSFNSTLMGKPMSEGRVFSQTFSQVLDRVSGALRIVVEAEDRLNPDLSPGNRCEFDSPEIRIGRDKNWADLSVGEQWGLVSGHHAVVRVIGNAVVYEPLSGRYAFALNGKPFTVPREMPNPSQLNLVSGAGPVLNVSFQFQKKPVLHPRTMLRAGEIARDEFKRLQTTFKMLVVMVMLGLPLLWGFSGVQKKVLGNYLDGIKSQNEKYVHELKDKITLLEKMKGESGRNQAEIRRLKNQIRSLERMDRVALDDADGSQTRHAHQTNRQYSGKISAERLKTAKIIDIKLSSQKISIYFPGVTFFPDQKTVFGIGFFIRDRNGKFVLVTEGSKVRSRGAPRAEQTFFFIYPDSWSAFERYYTDISSRKKPVSDLLGEIEKNVSRYNLMVIDGRQWRQAGGEYEGNTVTTSSVKDFPGYLIPYVPGIDSNFSHRDQLIVFGFRIGRKMVTPVNVSSSNRSVITVRSAVPGYLGGLLIRVLPDGKYSAIGLSHTGSGNAAAGYLKFLVF